MQEELHRGSIRPRASRCGTRRRSPLWSRAVRGAPGAPLLGACGAAGGRAPVRRRLQRQPRRAGPPPACSTPPCIPAIRSTQSSSIVSGRLQRSRRLLADARRRRSRRRSCHRHRRAQSRARLRAHARVCGEEPRWRSPAAVDAVVGCLFAPPSVLRQAAMPRRDSSAARCAPGTLVVLELASRARARGKPRRRYSWQGTLGAVPRRRFRAGAVAGGLEAARSLCRRARRCHERRRHLHSAQVPQPHGQEPHLPLQHLGALRQRGRLAHPDARQLGDASSPTAASARSSRPTCRC